MKIRDVPGVSTPPHEQCSGNFKKEAPGATVVLIRLGAASLDRSNARTWMPPPPTFKSVGQRLALTGGRGGCAGFGEASIFTLRGRCLLRGVVIRALSRA